MSQDLINRYQPGGDIYAAIQAKYGVDAANACAAAALTGDETQVNGALSQAMFGSPLPTNTAGIFLNQIATDPLGAPLDSLNSGLGTIFGNTIMAFLRNPLVLIIVGAIIFFALGGKKLLKKL